MSIQSFIPTVWSAKVLSRLNDALVFAQACNTDYEGEIAAFGGTVKINEIGAITIRSYTANSTSDITWEYLSDAQKELKIDQAKYFAFAVDDVDAAQAKGNVMDEAMTEAAWGIRNNIDEYVAALHSSAGLTIGSTGSGKDVTSGTVLRYLSEMQTKLDENNVPGPRWAVVPPWFAQKMVLAGITKLGSGGANLMRDAQGQLQSVNYGFDAIYVSNNVVNGASANNAKILAGYKGSIAMAVQVLKTEAARPAKQFVDLVKGLVVYGAKVVRPNSLLCLTADYTAEST